MRGWIAKWLGIHHHHDDCAQREILSVLRDLTRQGNTLMSVISEFAARQNAHNTKIEQGIDGLATDIQALNDKIEQLQNTQGAITPEDQALLNEIEAQGDRLAAKITSLDDLTPPPVPQG